MEAAAATGSWCAKSADVAAQHKADATSMLGEVVTSLLLFSCEYTERLFAPGAAKRGGSSSSSRVAAGWGLGAVCAQGDQDMLGTEVKYFSMVRRTMSPCTYASAARALLDRLRSRPGEVFAASIDKVIIDSDNLVLFQIDFTEAACPCCSRAERDRLCDSWRSVERMQCTVTGVAALP